MANEGVLFSLGDPLQTIWYRLGRLASRREVIDAIQEGLPLLEEIANKEGNGAPEALAGQLAAAWKLLPFGDEPVVQSAALADAAS